MEYDVAFSSSAGNAVLVGKTLFDIGVTPKKEKMKELIDKCQAAFISHKHGDHLNLQTYRYFCDYYPLKKIYVNEQTYKFINKKVKNRDLNNLVIFHDRDKILLDDGTEIDIYQTKHENGVFSTAYFGITPDLEEYTFATDFYDFKDLPQYKADYFFIEANHDKNYAWYLKQIEELGGAKLQPWIMKSTDRHTTKQAALKFFDLHRRDKQSQFIPLHKSSRFYDMQSYKEEIEKLMKGETESEH